MEDDLEEAELIADITPDVMRVLTAEKFFISLEEMIFPGGTITPNHCDHTYAVSTHLLSAEGHDQDAQDDVFAVMRYLGGFCDCEILLNAAPESPTRAAYWKKKGLAALARSTAL